MERRRAARTPAAGGRPGRTSPRRTTARWCGCYVGGAQVGDARAVTGALATSSGALRFGGNGVWAGEFFSGRLDELRVYDRALTAAEVAADMTRPVGPGAPARLSVAPGSLRVLGGGGRRPAGGAGR